eukprot:6132722-Alexandrium_andersonii.AAC.1
MIRRLQAICVGHVLRRPQDDPIKNLVFDRFLGARALGGPARPGVPGLLWGPQLWTWILSKAHQSRISMEV